MDMDRWELWEKNRWKGNKGISPLQAVKPLLMRSEWSQMGTHPRMDVGISPQKMSYRVFCNQPLSVNNKSKTFPHETMGTVCWII